MSKMVKCGAQHITYTAARDSGGGSLVGPGASPAAAPALSLVTGTGLGSGVYQYAYTDVTAAGESLPSPLGTITTGVLSPPTTAPGHNLFPNPSGYLFAGTYLYAVTFVTAAGETTPGPTLSVVVGSQSEIQLFFQLGPAGTIARNIYRTVLNGSQLKLDFTVADNTTTAEGAADMTGLPGVPDGSLGVNAPTSNTAPAQQVALSGIAIGASPTTSRKVYRTAVGGSQLKLLTTLANNTATTFADSTADGSLGANAPTSDTSALTQPTGQVLAGATSLLVAGAGAFASSGGWALIQGDQGIRYGGVTGNTLTGIPASGNGAITATVAYNSTIVDLPVLIGIPASGPGSIQYAIRKGDQVNVLVQVDDLAAQAALATIMSNDGIVDDGIIEDYVIDGTIGETEARARGEALLALKSTAQLTIRYKCRDKNTHAGRLVTVSLGAPTNISGTFRIQKVTISGFTPGMFPLRVVEASNDRFSLEDLLRMIRG